MLYVIAYDVADDRNRVRKSVYEADLETRELEEVLRAAAEYLSREDRLVAYPVGGSCWQQICARGRPRGEERLPWVIV